MAATRRRDATTATLHLKFLDVRVDVATNSLTVASRLESYFRRYLAPPERSAAMRVSAIAEHPEYDEAAMAIWERPQSPGRLPKESYYDRGRARYILKNRTGMLVRLTDDEARISGDIEQNTNQVVNLVNTMFGLALVERGYAMLHASAVARRGSDDVLIFMGNSGSGKSSLALQLIERGGFDYVSNDRALVKVVRGRVHVVGMPKKPRVNPGTLLASQALRRLVPARKRPAYEQMAPAELWQLEEKRDVDVKRLFGAGERLEGWLERAYSLEWRTSGTGLNVAPLDATGALAAMHATRKDFGVFDLGLRTRQSEPEFRRVARVAEFVQVSGKADPRRFAAEMAEAEKPPIPRADRRTASKR